MKRVVRKRILACMLGALMLFTVSANAAVIETEHYKFSLSAENGNTQVSAGDEFSVILTLTRTDVAENAAQRLYAVQDEIYFPTDYLEKIGAVEWLTQGFKESLRSHSDQVHKWIQIHFISDSPDGTTYPAVLPIAKIKFKALKSGVVSLQNQYSKVIVNANDVFANTVADLEITIATASGSGNGNGSSGTGTTPVEIIGEDGGIPLAGSDTPRFDDVPATHWAYDNVECLAKLGFVNGKTQTLFYPGDSITRGEFVTILARMSGEEMPSEASRFEDVNPSAYYAGPVTWASQAGITNGTGDTVFSPDLPIRRQEIAAMIVRYAVYKGYAFGAVKEEILFTDRAEIASYAAEAVRTLQQADIISGFPDASFRPSAYASRAECAKMLSLVHHAMYPGLCESPANKSQA